VKNLRRAVDYWRKAFFMADNEVGTVWNPKTMSWACYDLRWNEKGPMSSAYSEKLELVVDDKNKAFFLNFENLCAFLWAASFVQELTKFRFELKIIDGIDLMLDKKYEEKEGKDTKNPKPSRWTERVLFLLHNLLLTNSGLSEVSLKGMGLTAKETERYVIPAIEKNFSMRDINLMGCGLDSGNKDYLRRLAKRRNIMIRLDP